MTRYFVISEIAIPCYLVSAKKVKGYIEKDWAQATVNAHIYRPPLSLGFLMSTLCHHISDGADDGALAARSRFPMSRSGAPNDIVLESFSLSGYLHLVLSQQSAKRRWTQISSTCFSWLAHDACLENKKWGRYVPFALSSKNPHRRDVWAPKEIL